MSVFTLIHRIIKNNQFQPQQLFGFQRLLIQIENTVKPLLSKNVYLIALVNNSVNKKQKLCCRASQDIIAN